MRLRYIIFSVAILGLFWPGAAEAQSGFGPYEYVSPRPNAILVNSGTTIAVRHGDELDSRSLNTTLFTVVGEAGGTHSGMVILADDNKTVIFKPDTPFTPEDVVNVAINPGIKTSSGTTISDSFAYSFTVSSLTSVQASSLHRTRVADAIDAYDQQYDAAVSSENTMDAALGAPEQMGVTAPLTGTQSYATLPATYPHISVTVPADGAGDGHIFTINLTRRSAFPYLLILDNSGDPVYYRAMNEGVRFRDFRVQPNGKLTYFYQPDFVYHEMDNRYQVVGGYKAGNGYLTDFHGLQINEQGHALLQIYDDQPVDMSQIVTGGLVTATVTGAIMQELDPSGNVIFEWRSWDHFDILDASDEVDFTSDYVDVTHINSADWDTDGNIIMSNRNIDEVTKVSRASGDVIWRFGGKKNQFTLTNAAEEGVEFFNWQHDARRQATGTITIFDNGNHKDPPRSRAVEFELDEENLTATQVWQYRNVPDFFGFATGNVQRLPNGNSVIDWGGVGVNEHLPFITEVKADGTKAFEAYFVENQSSYRTFRFPWQGTPLEPPMLVATSIGDTETGSKTKLHFSWNGATGITGYEIRQGTMLDRERFVTVETVGKQGFEMVYEAAATNEPCTFYYVWPQYSAAASYGLKSNLLFVGDDSCDLVATMTSNAATDATLPLSAAGGSVAINAPTGVVSDSVTLMLEEIVSPTQPLPQDTNLVMAFRLQAQLNGIVQPQFRFNAPISLAVNYTDAAIAGLNETTVDVRYWDSLQQAWITDGIEITGRDAANNQVTFTTDHLTNFALFADAAEPTALDQTNEPINRALNAEIELLDDGSFEMEPADSPWAYWTESDEDEAFPLSCASHSCGYDNVLTRDGERVVFLGFFPTTETVRVSQSFDASTLAGVDQATLSLWIMRQGLEGSEPFSGNNTIKISIDDTELISTTGVALQEGRYVELTVDVTEHLSATHTLQIEGTFEANSGAFYVDDVSLLVIPLATTYLPFIESQ